MNIISMPTLRLLACACVLVSCGSVTYARDPAPKPPADRPRQLATTLANKPWKGDLDGMLERRMIRFDTPYSRSLYFIDNGRERGISAELVRDFERWVNKKFGGQLGKRPLTVYIVAATRDKLLPDLNDGLADVAVGNLTVTEERLKVVDMVAPDEKVANVEVLVTGPASPAIATVEDLAGKSVHVRKASSYYASLTALNERLKKAGKAPAKLELVPDALEDEDMLDMLNAGLLEAIVVDNWKARLWAQVLPKVKVRDDVVLREATRMGWAIRKDSPKLRALLTEFYNDWVKKSGVLPHRQRVYMKAISALNDAAAAGDQERFRGLLAYFQKYGRQYNLDPLMLAAQGYQESELDQSKKGGGGTIGVMQVKPETGRAIGVGDLHGVEANIHAGAKYLDHLMAQYFKDAKFDEQNRMLFALAAYNAGPGNIVKMRAETAKRGLDPDKWFHNVEVVTAERLGIGTPTYVRNIYKYYVSYKLATEAQAAAAKHKSEVAPAKR